MAAAKEQELRPFGLGEVEGKDYLSQGLKPSPFAIPFPATKPEGKNLVYFTVAWQEKYLKLLEMCLLTCRMFIPATSFPELSFLVICDEKFVARIKNLPVVRQVFPQLHIFATPNATCVPDACFLRTEIYNWKHIMDYVNILYLDIDVFVVNDLLKFFQFPLEEKTLYASREDGQSLTGEYHGHGLITPEVLKTFPPMRDGSAREGFCSGVLLWKNTPFNRHIISEIRRERAEFEADGRCFGKCKDQPFFNYVAHKNDAIQHNPIQSWIVYSGMHEKKEWDFLALQELASQAIVLHFAGGNTIPGRKEDYMRKTLVDMLQGGFVPQEIQAPLLSPGNNVGDIGTPLFARYLDGFLKEKQEAHQKRTGKQGEVVIMYPYKAATHKILQNVFGRIKTVATASRADPLQIGELAEYPSSPEAKEVIAALIPGNAPSAKVLQEQIDTALHSFPKLAYLIFDNYGIDPIAQKVILKNLGEKRLFILQMPGINRGTAGRNVVTGAKHLTSIVCSPKEERETFSQQEEKSPFIGKQLVWHNQATEEHSPVNGFLRLAEGEKGEKENATGPLWSSFGNGRWHREGERIVANFCTFNHSLLFDLDRSRFISVRHDLNLSAGEII